MEAPTSEHWAAVKHIMRYLKGTIEFGCKYGRSTELKPTLLGYSDSDFAGDIDGRKSTTGVIFFLGRCPISWQSTKQKIVAMSSCEAEYIAAAAAACQAIWLARLQSEIMKTEVGKPMLRIDNKSALSLIKNPLLNDKSRHIETRFHLIREYDAAGRLEVKFIRTEDQLGDIFTKSLARVKFQELCQRINVQGSS